MPIDFPSSANTGDIYTEGVYSYEYTGVKWKPVNRTDYNVQKTDISFVNGIPYNALTVDFDVDGIQYLIANTGGEIVFVNPPELGEYKKVTVDAGFTQDYIDTNYSPFALGSDISYDNISVSVSDEVATSSGVGLDFSSDGTKMFVGSSTTNEIYEYTLSDPWDITNASLLGSKDFSLEVRLAPSYQDILTIGQSGDVSKTINLSGLNAQEGDLVLLFAFGSAGADLDFPSASGFTRILQAVGSDAVDSPITAFYRFVPPEGLSTTTISYTYVNASTEAFGVHARAFRNVDQNDPIYSSASTTGANGVTGVNVDYGSSAENTMTVVCAVYATYDNNNQALVNNGDWDGFVSTSYDASSFGFAAASAYKLGGGTGDFTYTGTVSTSFSYASISVSLSPAAVVADITDFQFSENGNTIIVSGSDGANASEVASYDLPSPYNLTGATKAQSKNVDYVANGIFLEQETGSNFYVLDNSYNVTEYTLSTNYDISSTWTQSAQENFSPYIPKTLDFSNDGTKLYLESNGTTITSEISSWDLSSFVNYTTSTRENSGDSGLATSFDENGYRYYVLGYSSSVYQYASYTSNTDNDPSITWPSNLEWENGEAPALPDLSENMQIEIEARTDYRGTNYVARLVGRNF